MKIRFVFILCLFSAAIGWNAAGLYQFSRIPKYEYLTSSVIQNVSEFVRKNKRWPGSTDIEYNDEFTVEAVSKPLNA